MRKLTMKERAFIREYIESGGKGNKLNATASVMKVYNTKNRKNASTMAVEIMKKEPVKITIQQLLAESGYNPKQSIGNLIGIESIPISKVTATESIHASETLLKLSGYLVEKKQSTSVNYNLDNFDSETAYQYSNRYQKLKSKRKG